jgi:hypothetical protein
MSILTAISVEILLGFPIYNAKSPNFSSFQKVIKTPLEGWGGIGRTESESEYFKAKAWSKIICLS